MTRHEMSASEGAEPKQLSHAQVLHDWLHSALCDLHSSPPGRLERIAISASAGGLYGSAVSFPTAPTALVATGIDEELVDLTWSEGRVVLTTSRSARIATRHGTVTVVDAATGAVPLGVAVPALPDLRAYGPARGQPSRCADGRLVAGSLTVELAPAEPRSLRILPATNACPSTTAVYALRTAVVELAHPDAGMGRLASPDGSRDNAVQRRARHHLAGLCDALRDGDVARALAAQLPLVGLGEGLTPSGDDVTIGLLAMLWSVDHPARAAFADGCRRASPGRTTDVACDLVAHAARGRFVERVQWAVAALLSGEPIRPAAARLAHVGASSGIDTLVGMLAGAIVCSPSPSTRGALVS
jgi:hypothetical protein